MKVLIFGATGMVGQGVLRECLLDPDIEAVMTIGRAATGAKHPKLREIVRADLFDYMEIEPDLRGLDACFFCLGVSAAGVTEAQYERLTYSLTMAAAQVLARLNPQMTFIYVSGAGTDSSEKGSVRWARVKAGPRIRSCGYPSKQRTCSAREPFSPCTESALRWPLIDGFTPLPSRRCRCCAACFPTIS